MQTRYQVYMMAAYTQWADSVMLNNAAQLPKHELSAPRKALFGSIVGTFDHVLVVAEIFRAHLEARSHPHHARQRDVALDFSDVALGIEEMNAHFVSCARSWTARELDETIEFHFVDGGEGAMTRAQILLHLANHATYHRGFISTLLYPLQHRTRASDLSVFLRDAWPTINAELG